MKPKRLNLWGMLPLATALCATATGIAMEIAQASSHRDAPFIARRPEVAAPTTTCSQPTKPADPVA